MVEDAHRYESVKETAAKLGLHPGTVRRMIEQGAIPAVQLAGPGTSVRVDAAALETRLQQASTPAAATSSAARPTTASERGDARSPQLAGLQRSGSSAPDTLGPRVGARPSKEAT